MAHLEEGSVHFEAVIPVIRALRAGNFFGYIPVHVVKRSSHYLVIVSRLLVHGVGCIKKCALTFVIMPLHVIMSASCLAPVRSSRAMIVFSRLSK